MVVRDFDFVRALFPPAETKSVLLVDSNAVLSFPVTVERFQSVAWRAFQIVEAGGCVKDEKLGSGSSQNVWRERPSGKSQEQLFAFLAGESPDHGLSNYTINVCPASENVPSNGTLFNLARAPAARSPLSAGDFGNALESRWPCRGGKSQTFSSARARHKCGRRD